MANYRETTVDGARWQRCRCVTLDNPLGGAPAAYFQEEEVVTITEGQTFRRDVSSVSTTFDPEAAIALLDVTTGEPTGLTMTHAGLYQALFSAYRAAAAVRDAAE